MATDPGAAADGVPNATPPSQERQQIAAWGVTGATRLLTHLAHPTGHVRAPQMLNDAFRARGIDVVAIPVDVTPEHLHALVYGIRGWNNLAGLGVTMPHKQAMMTEVDEVVGLAGSIKAVNVVRREPDGRLVGGNTDGPGFVAGLRQHGRDPAGMRALVIGSGGAGRAIAFGLADANGTSLTLTNRTRSRAESLAVEIADSFPGLRVDVGGSDPTDFDIIVNATPLGMHAGDSLPINAARLRPRTIVAETIMSPSRTALMANAEARGCVVHPGLPMLTGQINMVLAFLRLI
jgi:shikimate dehydrogenase